MLDFLCREHVSGVERGRSGHIPSYEIEHDILKSCIDLNSQFDYMCSYLNTVSTVVQL